MKNSKLTLVLVVVSLLAGCASDPMVKPKFLEGTSWKAVEYTYFENIDLATWENVNPDADWDNPTYGQRYIAETTDGTWSFSDDGQVTVDVTFQFDPEDYVERYGFSDYAGAIVWQGQLDMARKQQWFGIEGDLLYEQIFFHEKSSKRLVLKWDENYGQHGAVHMLELEKE